MKMKKSIFLLLIVLAVFLITSLVSAETIKLDFAHVWAYSNNPYHNLVDKFKNVVEEKTDGRIEIVEHGAGELGSEREYIESLQMGTLDFAIAATGPYSGFTQAFKWADIPFMISDEDHLFKVFDSQEAINKLQEINKIDLLGLNYLYQGGFRGVFTRKRTINSVNDFNNLKVRTMENPIHVTAFRALGANPTPMAYGEVYTALQYGTIDAAENPLSGYVNMRFYEVAPNFSFTNHLAGISIVAASKKTWDKLSSDDRELLRNTLNEAVEYAHKEAIRHKAEIVTELKDKGVKFTYPDVEELNKAVNKQIEKYKNELSKQLLNKINELR